MRKILFVVGILGIVALALGIAGYAYAQDQTPPNPEYPYGPGQMGGYGRGRGGMMSGYGGYGMMGFRGAYGPMHESMVAALAEKTGLTVDEIEARHDAGETMWDIALDAGLSEEEIQELMFAVRDIALEEAIANGWITAEQAEWMNGHMRQMWDDDYGLRGGHCGGRGGFYGNSRWQGGDN